MARSAPQKERDKNFITSLYLKGYSCRYIASELCKEVGEDKYISYRTVNNDIRSLLKEWEKDRIDDINHLKLIELEKINKLERTYWEAWEKSVTDYQRTNKKIKAKAGKQDNSKPSPSEQEIATTDMISMGNPSYLSGIERCIQMRCKILGIEAPQKVDHTTKGDKIESVTIFKLPDNERD